MAYDLYDFTASINLSKINEADILTGESYDG
jgi:hypothetical protein